MSDSSQQGTGAGADDGPMPTEQVRHREFTPLQRPRELVLVCPDFKSNVNLSRIVRLAGCCAVEKIIAAGNGKIDPTIALCCRC